MPREFVKKFVFHVIRGNKGAIRKILKRAATDSRTAMQFLDLAAKLNKEIGGDARQAGSGTTINFYSNVDFMALRAAAGRAAPLPSSQAALDRRDEKTPADDISPAPRTPEQPKRRPGARGVGRQDEHS